MVGFFLDFFPNGSMTIVRIVFDFILKCPIYFIDQMLLENI